MSKALADMEEDMLLNLEVTYNQTIRVSQTIVEDIRFGRRINLDSVENCAVEICRYKKDDTKILAYLNSIKDKTPYLYAHPVNVAFISFVIGLWMHLDDSKLQNLTLSGLLHDIGKAKIKDSLLNKSEPLTLEEIRILKEHSVIGYKIINSVKKFDTDVLCGVLYHHERMDGTGYPLGIRGEDINQISKIIAIADIFDALTSEKPYRKKYSPLVALEVITESILHYDKEICGIFINNMLKFYCSRDVQLNNKRIGKIASVNLGKISKPIVCCEEDYFDLSDKNGVEIVGFL